MITCKICGHQAKERLIDHIIKTHKISVHEYKEKYGEYLTQESRARVSKKALEKWQNKEYRDKTNKARNDSWTDEKKQIQSEILKKFYRNGGCNWNKGLTKKEDKRLISIGEKNRKNLTGRKKEDYPYLQKKSERFKWLWKNSNVMTCMGWSKDEKKKKEWRAKISETLARKYSMGIIKNECNRYHNGTYINKHGEFLYSSGLEKNAMELFDLFNVEWTNKHGIRIKYTDEEGVERIYVPDFLIKIDDLKYVLETKGWITTKVLLKAEAAKKIFGDKYFMCFKIDDVKRVLNEICKNKKN